jgi:hypothetical protein
MCYFGVGTLAVFLPIFLPSKVLLPSLDRFTYSPVVL